MWNSYNEAAYGECMQARQLRGDVPFPLTGRRSQDSLCGDRKENLFGFRSQLVLALFRGFRPRFGSFNFLALLMFLALFHSFGLTFMLVFYHSFGSFS